MSSYVAVKHAPSASPTRLIKPSRSLCAGDTHAYAHSHADSNSNTHAHSYLYTHGDAHANAYRPIPPAGGDGEDARKVG